MVNVIRAKYDKQDFKKDNIHIENYRKASKKCFQSYADNYSNFLAHYFNKNGGVLDGFRFIDA